MRETATSEAWRGVGVGVGLRTQGCWSSNGQGRVLVLSPCEPGRGVGVGAARASGVVAMGNEHR